MLTVVPFMLRASVTDCKQEGELVTVLKLLSSALQSLALSGALICDAKTGDTKISGADIGSTEIGGAHISVDMKTANVFS
jgi:hypothetical protein